jgi:histidinol phosphatase-like enzyme (inositol monophosphatase family)|tara:strand:- start:2150 stop:3028 length:879 start_codon:yes stop_codon:yes gene_type:complete
MSDGWQVLNCSPYEEMPMSATLGFTTAIAVSADQKTEYLGFARSAARAAGDAILPYFRSRMQVTNKLSGQGFDPVTLADQAGERVIRAAIEDAYPDHGIFGEEFGLKSGNGLTWVIDPIDGTRAFMTGMLHWGVLLALFDGEQPIVGVMYQPYTDELFSGDNESAWYERAGESQSLVTSACRRVDEACLSTTGIDWLPASKQGRFRQLSQATKLTKMGGDCYLFGMLAMGSLDLGVEAGLNAYDIQALMPIVRGAGGVVTDWEGGNPSLGGTVLASATQALHSEAMTLLGSS